VRVVPRFGMAAAMAARSIISGDNLGGRC